MRESRQAKVPLFQCLSHTTSGYLIEPLGKCRGTIGVAILAGFLNRCNYVMPSGSNVVFVGFILNLENLENRPFLQNVKEYLE